MENKEQKPKKKIYKRWWFWLIVLIIVLAVGTVMAFNSVERKGQQAAEENKAQYEGMIKDKIASFLKSPGSAQFIDFTIKKSITDKNRYIIFGDIDSQNSFGALMRTNCYAEISYLGGDPSNKDNWKIENLDFDYTTYVLKGEMLDTPLPPSDEYLSLRKYIEDTYKDLPDEDIEEILSM